jgi:hypothetical protein
MLLHAHDLRFMGVNASLGTNVGITIRSDTFAPLLFSLPRPY